MSDFNIDYIKSQYCRYKCTAKHVEARDCNGCDIIETCCKLDINCSKFMDNEICEHCQVDNFIRELRDFKIIE